MPRRREFDGERVLDEAMRQFWRAGYEPTSVEDLVGRMGLRRGSIYNAFGDKRGVFLAALDRYVECVVRKRVRGLHAAGPGLETIRAFFSGVVDFAVGEGRGMGCLLVNTVVESSGDDAEVTARLRHGMSLVEDAFHAALLRARDQGEIAAASDCRKLALFLAISLGGLRVASLANPDPDRLNDFVDVVLAALA